MKLKVAFMGTPEFAIPALELIYKSFDLVGCFTQPSRPAGRGQKISHSPIKNFCTKNNIPIYTPENFTKKEEINSLKNLNCDVLVVAAYGIILPKEILEICKFGALNIHASLLPRWRGAAPIQRAILAGDEKTGITIMKMNERLDEGPIIASHEITLKPDATGKSLTEQISQDSCSLLFNNLDKYLRGQIETVEQNHDISTYANKINKQ